MPIFLIGLGLSDLDDVTIRGDKLIRSSCEIWLESYTSIFPNVSLSTLSERYPGIPVKIADRTIIESGFDAILQKAKTDKVAILIVGDPFSATTHSDLYIRAKKENVEIQVVHNASIMNAAGCCGLSLYAFGQTISIPLFQGNWRPGSFYDRLLMNYQSGSHTLCLLDIKVKEPNVEILTTKGKIVYDPPYFMTIREAIQQIHEIDEKQGNKNFPLETTMGVGLARVGDLATQKIAYGTLKQLMTYDGFGGPLHSLIIPGKIHEMEEEMLKYFAI